MNELFSLASLLRKVEAATPVVEFIFTQHLSKESSQS
jgi:hypothetical protein